MGWSPFGGASPLDAIISTPTRRGLTFVRAKVSKTRSRGTGSPLTNPFPAPCCAGYERRFSTKKPSVLHADGLNKVSQMHLPPPNLPRFGGGERPPFFCKPIAPLTITMGQRLIFRPIIVPHPNHRDPPPPQALTYPEHRTAALILSAHPSPFPASGKGVGGKGRCACGYLGSDSVRSTD